MTTLAQSPKTGDSRAHPRVGINQSGLEVRVFAKPGGPVVAREKIVPRDLSDAISETWRELCLRRGVMAPLANGVPADLLVVADKDSASRCLGYALELPGSAHPPKRAVFSYRSVSHVAHRAVCRLESSTGKKLEDTHHYELHHVQEAEAGRSDSPSEDASAFLTGSLSRPPLHYLSVPLEALLAQATASTAFPDLPVEKSPFPVFYTAEVFRQMEKFARQGAPDNPLFESGAVLCGALCSCPDSGEFFVVVYAAFEVLEADQTLTSLSYSGASWTRIQNVIRARQKTQPYLRMVGQTHGHNFIPNQGRVCEACPQKTHCDLHNLFASPDDETWSRAVFSHQPWQLCHIFALTARRDFIDGLFTLHDGRLAHRGYHLIPGFDPAAYPALSTT